ncbi:MAG: hypothetical protein ACFFD1_12425, partial [Candidatus Thorarchaeota archaeon]
FCISFLLTLLSKKIFLFRLIISIKTINEKEKLNITIFIPDAVVTTLDEVIELDCEVVIYYLEKVYR